MNKAARKVINYCIAHDIGTLIVGYNETFQRDSHIGKQNNQNNKAARKVINYCIAHDIGTLIVGYNETFQRDSHIGKQNNQNFVNIPYG